MAAGSGFLLSFALGRYVVSTGLGWLYKGLGWLYMALWWVRGFYVPVGA